MPNPLDRARYKCFIYVIRIILTKSDGKLASCTPRGADENGTNHKLTQQALVVVNGGEVPQEARFCVFYLCAVICSNNEAGIMWREQVLPPLNNQIRP